MLLGTISITPKISGSRIIKSHLNGLLISGEKSLCRLFFTNEPTILAGRLYN